MPDLILKFFLQSE